MARCWAQGWVELRMFSSTPHLAHGTNRGMSLTTIAKASLGSLSSGLKEVFWRRHGGNQVPGLWPLFPVLLLEEMLGNSEESGDGQGKMEGREKGGERGCRMG